MKTHETKHLNEATRPTRVPINGPRQLLTIPNQDPNYHYTVQVDEPGNLERFLAAGYEFVTDPGRMGEETVNKSERLNGQGTALCLRYKGEVNYAMRIRREWYDEDQAKLEELNRANEAGTNAPTEGGYVKVASRDVSKKAEADTFSAETFKHNG